MATAELSDQELEEIESGKAPQVVAELKRRTGRRDLCFAIG